MSTDVMNSGCDTSKGHRVEQAIRANATQTANAAGTDATDTTIRKCGKRSGKSRVKTGRRLPHGQPDNEPANAGITHHPKPGNTYNEKIKGVCGRRLSAFSGLSNSPKTAEPLPDIEA